MNYAKMYEYGKNCRTSLLLGKHLANMSYVHNHPPFLPVKSLDEVSLQIWQITQIFLPLDSSSINPREFLWASFEKGKLGEFSNEIEWNFCLFPAPPLGQLCQ